MDRTKKVWINGLFLAVTLAVNTLGATGIINGLSQKQVSDRYPTLITPSPATFGIWSVIYSLLIASVIVMIVKKATPIIKKPRIGSRLFSGSPACSTWRGSSLSRICSWRSPHSLFWDW
jgi:hypothetical protein